MPYADAGPSAYTWPVCHVGGSVVSVVLKLASAGWPPPQHLSRNLIVPDPLGPRIAIQYGVPVAIDAVGTGTSFHPPATGDVSEPCARSVPGWPPESV